MQSEDLDLDEDLNLFKSKSEWRREVHRESSRCWMMSNRVLKHHGTTYINWRPRFVRFKVSRLTKTSSMHSRMDLWYSEVGFQRMQRCILVQSWMTCVDPQAKARDDQLESTNQECLWQAFVFPSTELRCLHSQALIWFLSSKWSIRRQPSGRTRRKQSEWSKELPLKSHLSVRLWVDKRNF